MDKHPGGRPTKYTPEMCNLVMECGREGGTVAEMAAACDVSIQTLYEWSKVHPEFSESFTRGQELAEATWSKHVREGLKKTPSEFQGAANLKYMAQRFQERWSERQKIEHTGENGGPLVIERRIVNSQPTDT
jgi:hypothetical protein